jgi:hypothetical protein
MKKLLVALVVAATFTSDPSVSSAALAATKAIKVLPAKPFFTSTWSGSTGDQVSAFTTTPISIVLVGTVESSTPTTGTTSGNSDGFIQAVDYQGSVQWSLHLGGSGDEIATAIGKDKTGGYLVVGSASATPVAATPTSNDTTSATNPDGLTLEPTSAPTNSLTQLALWRVSSTGALLSTTLLDAKGVVSPVTLIATTTGYRIAGDLYQGQRFDKFSVAINSNYQFGQITTAPASKPSTLAAITTIKAGTLSYKSFLSDGPIKSIPSWKPKSAIPVVIGFNKLAVMQSAHYLQGKVLSLQWQSGRGLVVLTERSDGFGITII